MSRMVNGKWLTEDDIASVSPTGEFLREDSVLRAWVGSVFPGSAWTLSPLCRL